MLALQRIPWGTVVHLVSGLLAGLLAPYMPAFTISMTIAFAVYQYLDSWSEDMEETKADVVEYAAGLTAGVVMVWLLGTLL